MASKNEVDDVEGDREDFSSLLNTSYRCTSTGSLELLGVHKDIPPTTYEFESRYRKREEKTSLVETAKDWASRKWRKFSCRRMFKKNFPTISALKQYQVREYLPNDLVAGLTAGVTMIPQGMAYASLSTLPPIVGLYISFFASLTYFVVGTSHQLSWGCIAVLSILTGNVLDSYEARVKAAFPQYDSKTTLNNQHSVTTSLAPSVNFSESVLTEIFSANSSSQASASSHYLQQALSTKKKIEVVGAVTMISGIILAFLGKLGLGRVTTFMSDSLVTSFTVGVSFHVVSSQIKTVLDLNIPRQSGIFKLIKLWIEMLSNIDNAKPASIIISLMCIIILYVVKRFVNEKYKSKLRVPVPIELLVVIVATVTTAFTGLSDRYSVSIVKDIPIGVPSPTIPDLSLGVDYMAEGLVIIIVSFTQNVAMAKLMGLKHNYRIDSNQEMFACGIVSVVCSIFSGYTAGPSVSRSIIQDGAGGKTQVASLFAAALVFLVIMLIGPYFYYLPKCVLASIIIVSLRSMILKLTTVPALWRQSRLDALVWITTCAATVILETDLGLLAGIITSILLVLVRSQVGTVDVVSEVSAGDLQVWRSKDKYKDGQSVKGVKVIRFNSALYFANAEIMTDQVFKKTKINPMKMKKTKTIDIKVNDGGNAQSETQDHVTDDGEKKTENGQAAGKAKLLQESDMNLMQDSQADPSASFVEAEVPIKRIIFDLSSVSFVDVMGVQALESLIAKFGAVGVHVYFANAQGKCLDALYKMGFLDKYRKLVFINIEAALKCTGLWEEV